MITLESALESSVLINTIPFTLSFVSLVSDVALGYLAKLRYSQRADFGFITLGSMVKV